MESTAAVPVSAIAPHSNLDLCIFYFEEKRHYESLHSAFALMNWIVSPDFPVVNIFSLEILESFYKCYHTILFADTAAGRL